MQEIRNKPNSPELSMWMLSQKGQLLSGPDFFCPLFDKWGQIWSRNVVQHNLLS